MRALKGLSLLKKSWTLPDSSVTSAKVEPPWGRKEMIRPATEIFPFGLLLVISPIFPLRSKLLGYGSMLAFLIFSSFSKRTVLRFSMGSIVVKYIRIWGNLAITPKQGPKRWKHKNYRSLYTGLLVWKRQICSDPFQHIF